MPARTSVGKCTYKYILEKPIRIASTKAGIQIFFSPAKNNAVTAASEDDVCPDGKEYPSGRGINSCTVVFISHGLSLTK